jgi:hypothetical protein
MGIDHAIPLDPEEENISCGGKMPIEVDVTLNILDSENGFTCLNSSNNGDGKYFGKTERGIA